MKQFKSFYKEVGGNEGSKCNYPIRLDTYGCGCSHDCKYCYAKSLLSFRGLWNPQSPSVANVEKLKKQINKLPKNTIVRLGGMTDCFQPIELSNRVTYKIIKYLNKKRIGYLIVTKSDIVANDEYLQIYDKELAHFQITVTTTDDSKSVEYEKAAVPSKRIKAIEKLYENGFDVQVRLSPFIYEYIDFDILNNIKCNKILVEFLRVNHWIKQWFNIDYSKYSVKHAGYEHLPLELKKKYLQNITGFEQISICEDVDEHFEYWKSNINHNKKDCCNLGG